MAPVVLRDKSHYLVYALLALTVLAPLLAPGYILTLDMVFPPEIRLPGQVGSSYLFYAVLHFVNFVVPTDIIQKIMLFLILFLSGMGMHRLLDILFITLKISVERLALYAAGALYMINPFTYDRFMAGQFAVLLGYALLPWFLHLLIRFLQKPGWARLLRLTGMALVISIVSVHTIGLLTIIVLATLPLVIGQKQAGLSLRYGLIGLVIFVVASSYWLLPLALGTSSAARAIEQFDSSHAAAFATTGSTFAAIAWNVLSLQGFWAERYGLYLLPQDQLPGWGTVRLLLWMLVGAGMVIIWRRSRRIAAMLYVLIGSGLLLGIGLLQPLLTAIGYREPHKFAGLVALGFALGAGFGACWLLAKAGQKGPGWYTSAVSGILITVLLMTPTMYWGFAGQLAPRHYPADWFALNERLNRDPGRFNTVFLPWHQYMSFGFAGRVIANPAPRFFDTPMLVSNDPELEGIRPPRQDPKITTIGTILKDAPHRHDIGERLATHDVRYVVLAKEYDYRTYNYLDEQPGLSLQWETQGIKLYQVTPEGR
jgi:hypothetical protein